MPPKLFSFTLFRKNASATPLVSDTFKTTIRPGMVVLSEHREPKDPSESCKPFRLIHFRKNAFATPLVSHTFKTKDLKPFRFTHFQKKGGGRGVLSNLQPHTSNLCSPLSPLDSALTSKRGAKSFTSNTYEKHTGGEGVEVCLGSEHKSRVHESRITDHESRVTDHASQTAMVHSCRPL